MAERNNFVKPKINENGVLDIKGGRHPVVEQMIENDMLIANDTYLDNQKKRVSVITGPNMAGKSTYMRQTALRALMQMLINTVVPVQTARNGWRNLKQEKKNVPVSRTSRSNIIVYSAILWK